MSTINPATWCSPPSPPPPIPDPPPKPNQLVGGQPSALCSTGWQPILITGLLRDMLVRHFSQPLNPEQLDLRRYIWRDDLRSAILIESIHRWRGELTEKRPALILKRNAYQNIRFGIGDYVRTTKDGFYEFQTAWVGSHTVFCIHGSGASVEILATEVQRQLTQFHPVIVQYLGLLRWAVTEVGAIAEIEEAKEDFVVPITVGWAYAESWRLELESMKLRRIPLSMLLSF